MASALTVTVKDSLPLGGNPFSAAYCLLIQEICFNLPTCAKLRFAYIAHVHVHNRLSKLREGASVHRPAFSL